MFRFPLCALALALMAALGGCASLTPGKAPGAAAATTLPPASTSAVGAASVPTPVAPTTPGAVPRPGMPLGATAPVGHFPRKTERTMFPP